jgi:hypothetical protein
MKVSLLTQKQTVEFLLTCGLLLPMSYKWCLIPQLLAKWYYSGHCLFLNSKLLRLFSLSLFHK